MPTFLAMLVVMSALAVPAFASGEESGSGYSVAEATPGPAASPDPQTSGSASQQQPFANRRATVAFDLGLASAVGTIGISGSYMTASHLQTELGVGLGFTGVQLSAMQKILVGSESSRARFVAGLGIAFATGSEGRTGPSLWLNADLAGMELRTSNGFVFFVVGGFTTGLLGGRLNTAEFAVSGDQCHEQYACKPKIPGLTGPQGRIGLGHWF